MIVKCYQALMSPYQVNAMEITPDRQLLAAAGMYPYQPHTNELCLSLAGNTQGDIADTLFQII